VTLPAGELLQVLRWLNPADSPQISMGVETTVRSLWKETEILVIKLGSRQPGSGEKAVRCERSGSTRVAVAAASGLAVWWFVPGIQSLRGQARRYW
jgi:hypothetical protein